jgi:DNA-binding SARP family transcriptional activator
MSRLTLSFLGSFQASLDGKPITQFESNKVRALLVYLAVEADRPHRRETLAGLLWPDWPQASAMSSLRNALAELRRNIGDREAQPPFLLITRDSIQLNPQGDWWMWGSSRSCQHSALSTQQSVISRTRFGRNQQSKI